MGQRHLQAGVPLISSLNCCLTTTGTNTWEEVRRGWSEKGAEGNEPGGTAGGQERKRRGRLQTDHGRPFIQGSRIRIRHISFSVFAENWHSGALHGASQTSSELVDCLANNAHFGGHSEPTSNSPIPSSEWPDQGDLSIGFWETQP